MSLIECDPDALEQARERLIHLRNDAIQKAREARQEEEDMLKEAKVWDELLKVSRGE